MTVQSYRGPGAGHFSREDDLLRTAGGVEPDMEEFLRHIPMNRDRLQDFYRSHRTGGRCLKEMKAECTGYLHVGDYDINVRPGAGRPRVAELQESLMQSCNVAMMH